MGDKSSQFDPTAVEILRASIPHVPFDGWGEAALLAGANERGYNAEAVRAAFPSGATDAIALHSRLADQSMADAFFYGREGRFPANGIQGYRTTTSGFPILSGCFQATLPAVKCL